MAHVILVVEKNLHHDFNLEKSTKNPSVGAWCKPQNTREVTGGQGLGIAFSWEDFHHNFLGGKGTKNT